MKKFKIILLFFGLMIIAPNVYAEELKTGTYKIHYGKDDNKLLVEKDGNIELGDKDSTGITTWDIFSDGDNFYIKSSDDNSTILGSTGSASNGTNIKTSNTNNSKYQKWQFVYADSKYYYIRSSLGNYNIDVIGGHNEVGSNIRLWSANGTVAQKWRLERIDENNNALEDGTYMIKASNNHENVIDLSGGKTNNSTNVQVYKSNYTWAQLWNIKYEDGYYTINTYLADNKVLDISGGVFKKGSNVQLYQSNKTNAQKWILEKNSDDTYSFSSYDGLWKIDISSGSKSSGANLQIYQTNGTAAQKFIFEKVDMSYLKDGYYTISSLLGTDMVVGIDNAKAVNNKNVSLTKNNESRYTKWYIKRLDKDTYTIANAQNRDKVLDVQSGKTTDGSNVQLYQSNKTAAQKWTIRRNSDNTYRIIGVGSSKSLDVKGGSSNEGTNIHIYSFNDTNAQKFNITPVEQNMYESPAAGKYVINSKLYQNKAVDIKAASKDNNTNVQLWSSNNTKAQVWKLENIGEGKYVIRSMINPNIVLSASSTNVVSRKYNSSDDQKWYFYKDSDNEMTIYNIGQGKYLKIDGNSDGSNISLTDAESNKNEIILSPFTQEIKYRGIDVSSHNGNINWESIRNQIDFVIIRAGYSAENIVNGKDKYEDIKFLHNVEECEKYNIPYGFYLYSYAKNMDENENSARKEAEHMLALINKAKTYGKPNLSVPIYYDVEDDSTFQSINYDATTLTNINEKFCSIIESNGYQCGLYTFLYGFGYMGKDNVKNLASKYGIWVAHVKWYDFNTEEDQFAIINSTGNKYDHSDFEQTYSIKENIWQYSHEGNIPAANTSQGRVDLNIGYNIFG